MQEVTYQTVKLGRGRHGSPAQGACVMELASMLAGEPFSDHPKSVSPTIAAFLRAYNDLLDDSRRQDLYEYAARTVGTVAAEAVEQLRAERLIAWGDEMRARARRLPGFGRARRHRRTLLWKQPETPSRYAIKAIRKMSDEMHAAALALVDDLIEIGSGDHRPLDAEPASASAGAEPISDGVDPLASQR